MGTALSQVAVGAQPTRLHLGLATHWMPPVGLYLPCMGNSYTPEAGEVSEVARLAAGDASPALLLDGVKVIPHGRR